MNPRKRVDITFGATKVAVFVDGCFWHGCPIHSTEPKRNVAFWTEKLARNRARDLVTNDELENAGWLVLRFWEHEDVSEAAEQVEQAVSRRRKSRSAGRQMEPPHEAAKVPVAGG